jgi:hypothetical protein
MHHADPDGEINGGGSWLHCTGEAAFDRSGDLAKPSGTD